MNVVVPNKDAFKLSEVCTLTSVKPYVIRFWENEFEQISPTVKNNEKFYSSNDVQIIAYIKKLLFEDKMTIEKARLELSNLLVEPANVEPKRIVEEESFELEKLEIAKGMLEEIVSQTKAVQETHHWNA